MDKIGKKKVKYFTASEFDSPDMPGSGELVSLKLVEYLSEIRERCGFPFRVNSGYRTKAYNLDLKKRGYQVSMTSSHMIGLAADISITSSDKRAQIIAYALEVSNEMELPFRLGVAATFVHIDIDTDKKNHVVWTY